jgi:hypothetical protein
LGGTGHPDRKGDTVRTVTIERTYYTVRELEKGSPTGFARALDEYAQQECEWQDWSDEAASLKALDDLVGYSRNYPGYSHRGLGDCAELTGPRALAWLENVVIGPLRLRWGYMSAPGPWGQERRKHARYKERPGTVPSCPLTGYYTDEVLLDDLRDSLRGGMSVGDAMLALETKLQRLIDEELDYRTSEEAFIERAEDEGWEFLSSGQKV